MKIIIDNRSDVGIQDLLVMVSRVIQNNEPINSITSFITTGNPERRMVILSKKNKSSVTYVAYSK